MKRTLLLLLPIAVACAQQPVEQLLEGQELINKFSGRWQVYNVESGEYESIYWVIDSSGLCYLVCDEALEGNPICDDYRPIEESIRDSQIDSINDNDDMYGASHADIYAIDAISGRLLGSFDGGECTGDCKIQYLIGMSPPLIRGLRSSYLEYSGTYIDSLDIWTNKYHDINYENVYRNGTYELHRMKG